MVDWFSSGRRRQSLAGVLGRLSELPSSLARTRFLPSPPYQRYAIVPACTSLTKNSSRCTFILSFFCFRPCSPPSSPSDRYPTHLVPAYLLIAKPLLAVPYPLGPRLRLSGNRRASRNILIRASGPPPGVWVTQTSRIRSEHTTCMQVHTSTRAPR